MRMYRQTHIKKNLELRALVIQAVRRFFIEQDYLEVETPCRIPSLIPEAHIDTETSGDWFLQASPEICMKQLLAAGFKRIFQICKCFRKKERGGLHLPEITLLEWYCAGIDYIEMMTQCESLLGFVGNELNEGDSLSYQGREIDLKTPWDRMTVSQAFDRYASISMEAAIGIGRFDETVAFEIEPRLGWGKPLFLYEYPSSKAPLAKLKADTSTLARRFELYINGVELCNAFAELNDADEQRKRFEKERQIRAKEGKTIHPMPERFLKTLDDMPDASGNALGIDRLVMLFCDAIRIDDVVTFIPEEL